jgi:hypothetical protein
VATLRVAKGTLSVLLTSGEKIAGVLRDVDVPLNSVRDVEVVREPIASLRGVRAPGLRLPRRAIGTWRRRGERTLVSIRRGQPAVRVRLEGARWDALLVGSDDADALAAAVAGAR